MSGVPDYALSTTVYVQFTTRAFATGVPTTLAGTPVISVLEENNATPITSGVSLSVDRASVTGLNEVTIVASGANGFETGKDYAAYISTGTVGGTSVVGEVVGRFSIEKQSALRPITAGRTLSVGASGETILTSAYDYAKGTVAMTEAYATNGAAPTPVQATFAIHQMLMDFTISGTNYTVKKLDNSTTAFVAVIDDASTPTAISRT